MFPFARRRLSQKPDPTSSYSWLSERWRMSRAAVRRLFSRDRTKRKHEKEKNAPTVIEVATELAGRKPQDQCCQACGVLQRPRPPRFTDKRQQDQQKQRDSQKAPLKKQLDQKVVRIGLVGQVVPGADARPEKWV